MTFVWFYYIYLSCFIFSLTKTSQTTLCPFDAIYQLGDSTSDTGNLIRVQPFGPFLPAASLPYGETFPGMPTGRWSDGRLIVDYIAMDLGLPLLNPYLQQNASFRNGVNFAVAGATALDISFLAARGVQVPNVTTPLSGQLNWFQTYLGSICSTKTECVTKLKNALILVGDIGNNDIDYALSQNKTIQEIQAYVPFIAEAIANATREIIQLGGTRIIVPGAFPLGCLPINLRLFPNAAKDSLGCLRNVNNLSKYFNTLLQKALLSLKIKFPEAVIVYADYYNAFEFILSNGPVLGFNSTSVLKACCGNGDSSNSLCGSPGVPVCPNPSRYIFWDGGHYTQEAHRRISEYLLPIVLPSVGCFQDSQLGP